MNGGTPGICPPSLCDAAHAQDATPDAPSPLHFGLVAFAFLIIIMAGGLPTPLYVVYQRLWGFSPAVLTVVFASYAAGLLAILVLFRRVSDRLGRKRVLLAGVLVAIVSTGVFLGAQNVTWLIVARVLSGASVGLTASTASAALTEFEPSGDRKRAAQWVSVITALGVGAGPFYAGVLVEYAPDPLTLSFWVLLALLVASLVAVLMIREAHRGPRASNPAGAQLFRIPEGIRPVFALSALGAFLGFSLAGMFSGLAPSFLGEDLRITNHAVGGAVVLLMFGSAAAAQLALQGKSRELIVRLGGALVPLGLLAIATAVGTGLTFPFFVGTVVCGAGFGLCLLGGLGTLNRVAPPQQRAEVLSAFYVAAYLGLSVPVVGIGILANLYGLPTAAVVLSVVLALLSIPVILSKPSVRPEGPPTVAQPTVSK